MSCITISSFKVEDHFLYYSLNGRWSFSLAFSAHKDLDGMYQNLLVLWDSYDPLKWPVSMRTLFLDNISCLEVSLGSWLFLCYTRTVPPCTAPVSRACVCRYPLMWNIWVEESKFFDSLWADDSPSMASALEDHLGISWSKVDC